MRKKLILDFHLGKPGVNFRRFSKKLVRSGNLSSLDLLMRRTVQGITLPTIHK